MKRRGTQKTILMQVVHVENGKFRCKADENCNYQQETLMPGNFKRHIFKMHPVVYAAMDLPAPATEKSSETPKKKAKKLLVDSNTETVLLGLLQLATVNHFPRSFPEMLGFKTLLSPLCDAAGVTANRRTIAALVDNSALTARKMISEELNKQKMITIEVDGGTRGNRHFVGINARTIIDGKVVVRNLGKYVLVQSRQFFEMLTQTIHATISRQLSLICRLMHSSADEKGIYDTGPNDTSPKDTIPNDTRPNSTSPCVTLARIIKSS